MIDNDSLDADLRAALATCTGFSRQTDSPGVASGTLVGKGLWLFKNPDWVEVRFTGTPSSGDQSTATTIVANHAPTAVQLMRLKMKAAGLEPPAFWAKLLKDTPAQWDQLTPGQQATLNAIIAAGALATRLVVQA